MCVCVFMCVCMCACVCVLVVGEVRTCEPSELVSATRTTAVCTEVKGQEGNAATVIEWTQWVQIQSLLSKWWMKNCMADSELTEGRGWVSDARGNCSRPLCRLQTSVAQVP